MSIRLYVGNLPKELERKELEELFTSAVGEVASTKVVTDRKTGKCRGFGFVTVDTEEQADLVIEKLNGQAFKDSTLKIEKALPKNKEGAANDGGNRRKAKGGRQGQVFSSSQPESFQPDPRWAKELETLKERLMAQTQA